MSPYSSLYGTVNNYNPSGLSTCNFLRLKTNGGTVTLTGIQAPNPLTNQLIMMVNLGSGTIVCSKNNENSSSNNQFINNNDITLNLNECVIMMYDVDSTGWRIFGVQNV